MINTAMDRDTSRVGLFIGDHSANDANPHRSRCSSKSTPARTRLTVTARIHANRKDTNKARISAANPGKKFANLVRKWIVEFIRACFLFPHKNLRCCLRQLKVEAVWPAPAGRPDTISRLRKGAKDVSASAPAKLRLREANRWHTKRPAQIQRAYGLKRVVAANIVKAMRQSKIVDNFHPQLVRHPKLFNAAARQLSQLEQSGRRQHEAPDLLKFAIS